MKEKKNLIPPHAGAPGNPRKQEGNSCDFVRNNPMEDSLTGYVAALIAIVCFGSNFVFAKNVELGDGVIFQFCMCCAIWCTSIPVLINVGTFPANTNEFSTAMLGGA